MNNLPPILQEIKAARLAKGLTQEDFARAAGIPRRTYQRLESGDPGTRIDTLFRPFHAAVARRLDLRAARGETTFVIGVHSYTPVFKGVARPWHAGILYSGATVFAQRLLKAIAEPGLTLGDNQPYCIDADDYTVPVHGDARGLPSVLVEVRHDLIATHVGVREWGDRLTRSLTQAMAADG